MERIAFAVQIDLFEKNERQLKILNNSHVEVLIPCEMQSNVKKR